MVFSLLLLGIAGGILPIPAPKAEAQGLSETASSVGNVINDTPGSCAQRGGTWNGVTGAGYCSVSPNSPAGRVQGGFDTLKNSQNDTLGCGFSSSFDAAVCLSGVVYVFTVGLGSGLAYISAFMLDTSVSLSLNSAAYALTFLSAGWTTTRDLANMAFILILVYLAFTIMFRAETTNTIRTLAWVIFIALIINFSFFFTRVVIDAGNILAVQFYNSVGTGPNGKTVTMAETFAATNSGTGALANTATGAISYVMPNGTLENTKDLTASIMHGLNVQELFSNSGFKSFAGNSGFGSKIIVLLMLYFAVGACYFILAAMFLAVGVKFIIRIAVLWFLIIASPLAFVCKAVPNKPHISGQYDKWQSMLVSHAFYPAFFLFIFFFLSVIMASMNADGGIMGNLAKDLNALAANPNLGGGTYLLNLIAVVFIRLGLVIAMLYIALKASEALSVKGSEVARSVTGFAFSQTGRLASAPVGYFARNTIGWGGAAMANKSADFERKAVKAPFLKKLAFNGAAKATKSVGTSLGTATFDPRNAPGASILKKGVQKITSGPINAGSPPAGGYIAQKKERDERIKKEQDARAKLIKEVEGINIVKELVEKSTKLEAIDAISRSGGTLTPAQTADRHKLKADVEKLSKEFNGLSKEQADSIKLADLEKALKHGKEGIIKKIEESSKRTDKEKASIRGKWEDASVHHAQNLVKNLAQIHTDLTTHGNIPAASLTILKATTQPSTLIDDDQVKDVLKELKREIPLARGRMTAAVSQADKDREKENMRVLQEARDYVSQMDIVRKGIPDGKGGSPKAGEFVVA